MSENILSLEDLKFLEQLYSKHAIETLRFDENGVTLNNSGLHIEESGQLTFLEEISRKLKFRLQSNCQLNFRSGFNFDVVRI